MKMMLLFDYFEGDMNYSSFGRIFGVWSDWNKSVVTADGKHSAQFEHTLLVYTVFQVVLVVAALLQPEFGTLETEEYIKYLR
ncbi:hypothetical protein C5167_022245 [Papaver somniferum]|uniref:Uncharacterized protein n=1 Tax=Papaver somniferum TaxID=3469 RepID=A0A4Y7JLE2_PAPSO|nr:hypothetical protein C5167_022245 [Papaver somniferum]